MPRDRDHSHQEQKDVERLTHKDDANDSNRDAIELPVQIENRSVERKAEPQEQNGDEAAPMIIVNLSI